MKEGKGGAGAPLRRRPRESAASDADVAASTAAACRDRYEESRDEDYLGLWRGRRGRREREVR